MRKGIYKILVTGGCGFIGSEFVRQLARDCSRQSYNEVFKRGLSLRGKVIVVDKLTYAGDLKRLEETKGKIRFYKVDICDKKRIEAIFKKENPDVVVNFAAETHVDRSILNSASFIETNVRGTHNLLEASKNYQIKRFIHLSTDEVYGEIKTGSFSEDSPLRPNSPYAASKAAADLLLRSYIRTYDFPAVIIRPCNNYGPWQYPEKLIPVAICNAMENRKIPVYAKGLNVREWLHVSDCAQGIVFLLNKAKTGEIYNLGSGHQERNIDLAKIILRLLGKPSALIEFVKDRPGHDWRYAIDSSKIRRLGWRPRIYFSSGLGITITWNMENRKWLREKLRSNR